MADRATLQRGPGTLVDRSDPTGWVNPEGDFAWVFGNDQPGWTGRFNANDVVLIQQTDTVGAAKAVRLRAFLRGPRNPMPSGWKWYFFGGDTTVRIIQEMPPESARVFDELIFNTRGYSGTLTYGLIIIGPAGTEEIEIPAAYIDDIVLDAAPAEYFVANRSPIPGESNVSRTTLVNFDLIETGTSDADLTNTQIYINGVLAYDGTAGGQQPGYVVAITALAAGHQFVSIQVPYTFDSLDLVDVRVVSQNLTATSVIDVTWSFTIEDYTPPRVLSAVATGHKTVRVVFDEEVLGSDPAESNDALNPDNWSFEYQTAPAVDVEAVSVVQVSPTTYDITTDIELSQGATYRVIAANIEDSDNNGNVVVAPYDDATFVAYECPAPSRRFELWKMVPRINRDEDVTRDLYKFLSVLQEPTSLLLCDIDRFTDIIDVDIAAERYLEQMLIALGNPFELDLDEAGKRKLVRILVEIYQLKGTAPGLISVINFFLGIEVTIDAWSDDGWELGVDELGEDSILGPGTTHERFSFTIISPVFLTDEERSIIREIAEYMKPAHTHLAAILEPEIPDVVDHLVLGVSLLDTEWILH